MLDETSKTRRRTILPPKCASGAIRMVLDHEHEHPSRSASIMLFSAKIFYTAQTPNEWAKKAEVDGGKRSSVPTEMAERIEALERVILELRNAYEILRKASAHLRRRNSTAHFGSEPWRHNWRATASSRCPGFCGSSHPIRMSMLPQDRSRPQIQAGEGRRAFVRGDRPCPQEELRCLALEAGLAANETLGFCAFPSLN